MERQRRHNSWQDVFDRFRLRVSRPDAVVELSALGLLGGVVAGFVSIVFRLVVERSQAALLGAPGGYEALNPWVRLTLPIAGGAFIGLVLQFSSEERRMVGVAHVMERLAYWQGHVPVWNAVVQFVGGAVAIVTGHSVGREGPGVHLGVAATNLPAQRLHLPNNSLRVLAACGTAAAIAASFNTPLAGVIFAVEVLMLEYSVAAAAPVILAAVVATFLSRMVFGPDLAFSVPPLSLGSLYELPLVVIMGILIGTLSATFTGLLQNTFRQAPRLPAVVRGLLAGLIIGLMGFVVPEVMGIGYGTVDRAIVGNIPLMLLLVIIAFKLLASTVAVGLGIPGGLIGPALVVGAATGGAFAVAAHAWGPAGASHPGFYVLLGMGAMMAATLQAPLAGLTAILELTGEPNIIFPGMLAVIAATLTSGLLHGRESMYLALLRAAGRDYRNDPVARSLRQIGVGAAMSRSFVQLPQRIASQELEDELEEGPRWILLRREKETALLLPAVDVVRALREAPVEEELDLLALPASRLYATAVDIRATLEEARERMSDSGAEALYITQLSAPGISRVYGVLTREEIESAYRLH